MEQQEKKLDRSWETELVNRIAEMEHGSEEVKSMTKKDYILAGVITIVCLLAVVAGAFI